MAVIAALHWLAACGGGGTRDEAGDAAPAAPLAEAASPAGPGGMPLRRPSRMETRLLPPNAVIGADVDAGAASLSFQTRQGPARLLDWFKATGNGADFILESEMQEGAEYVFSGRVRATGEAYSVRIAPGTGGGTTGTILITPR